MKKISIVALGLFMSLSFATASYACGDEAAAKKCGDKAKTCCSSKKDAKSANACAGKHKKATASEETQKEVADKKDAKKASN